MLRLREVSMDEVDACAEAVWPWIRRWWEPRKYPKTKVGHKGRARLLVWAVLATSEKWRKGNSPPRC